MLLREAGWMATAVKGLGLPGSAKVLNVGSSTGRFRAVEQPWIDERVFAPLRASGVQIVHLDMKPADGVDVVGDLLVPEFRSTLARAWDVVICSNLLEHLEDRRPFLEALPELCKPGGWLVVTAPRRFPHHPDPIDTMYRPSPGQLVDDLIGRGAADGFEIVDAVEVFDHRHWWYWAHYSRLRGRHPVLGMLGTIGRSVRQPSKRAELRTLAVRTSATCVLARVV